ncbi:MAG TPA: lipoate--protein ligase family protein [Bacteroidota bacterium]|nr:lipoate--protein ligase family protein [Bacteroidota bacterium]
MYLFSPILSNVLFVDHTPDSPAGELALDEALLDLLEQEPGEGFLRFWEPGAPCVILGRTNDAAREVHIDRCGALGIPILRRASGGGTVVQGPGCLNFSLVLNMSADPRLASPANTTAFVLGRHVTLIGALSGQEVSVMGSSDLAIGGKKFSGNAQRRRLRAILFHGSFLLDFDIALVEELLPMPSREPDYRKGRSHAEFLMNLRFPAGALKDALRTSWGADRVAPRLPLREAGRLAAEKYSSPVWTLK